LQIQLSIQEARANREVILQCRPVIIPDIYAEDALASAIRTVAGEELETTYGYLRCWMGVPLIVKDQVVGMLTIDHRDPDHYSSSHAELALAFANQAAVAIENARLYEAAEHAAIAAERNRLARDLHDAVTQTLFSATMIADVLPRIWERNPEQGQLRLEELRQLTRGALSEMRTLLVELRPAALVDTDLGDLIGHLVNALIARIRIPVDFECNCDYNPPPEIKEMFYRVTQEAFNNIAKHAEAKSVKVALNSQSDQIELLIQDDGLGFNFEVAKNEGLGLGIMIERATNVGAHLDIRSRLKEGARLKLVWQENDEKEHSK
jgi:two-component system nitrate/nitrite sensor histidine kinase NarX